MKPGLRAHAFNPEIALELRYETSNGKKYALGGTSQRLIPEMRSSATDTGDKASASADSDLQPSCPVQLCCRGWGCNRFSNAISGFNTPPARLPG